MKTNLVLKKYLERKKKSSPGYSLRVLARQLDLSPSFLSRVFSGQKAVPSALLEKLASALEIESEIMHQMREGSVAETDAEGAAGGRRTLRKGALKPARAIDTELEDWSLVDKKSFSVLRQWFYLPLIELTTTRDFGGTEEAIAERLGLAQATVEVAVRELLAAGLLVRDENGLRKATKKLRWGSSRSVAEVRRFHDQMMTKAQETLRTQTTEDDFAKRLISGITITASPDKIAAAKVKLAECLHEIANDLIEEEGTEVYHLAAQLFPLTKT